jgi:hypothetical protein
MERRRLSGIMGSARPSLPPLAGWLGSDFHMIARSILSALALIAASSWEPASAGDRSPARSGLAAIYAYKGAKAASGEPANPAKLTAAHRSLPFGTMVRVINTRNGRSVVVRINDRGIHPRPGHRPHPGCRTATRVLRVGPGRHVVRRFGCRAIICDHHRT